MIAEFPFGDTFDEAGYTFAAGYHGKPIINGYSGFFPAAYQQLKRVLAVPAIDIDVRAMLIDAGATHAIVHESGFADRTRPEYLGDVLRSEGAEEIARVGTDRVFRLR